MLRRKTAVARTSDPSRCPKVAARRQFGPPVHGPICLFHLPRCPIVETAHIGTSTNVRSRSVAGHHERRNVAYGVDRRCGLCSLSVREPWVQVMPITTVGAEMVGSLKDAVSLARTMVRPGATAGGPVFERATGSEISAVFHGDTEDSQEAVARNVFTWNVGSRGRLCASETKGLGRRWAYPSNTQCNVGMGRRRAGRRSTGPGNRREPWHAPAVYGIQWCRRPSFRPCWLRRG
jgi:hypothetical protein